MVRWRTGLQSLEARNGKMGNFSTHDAEDEGVTARMVEGAGLLELSAYMMSNSYSKHQCICASQLNGSLRPYLQ